MQEQGAMSASDAGTGYPPAKSWTSSLAIHYAIIVSKDGSPTWSVPFGCVSVKAPIGNVNATARLLYRSLRVGNLVHEGPFGDFLSTTLSISSRFTWQRSKEALFNFDRYRQVPAWDVSGVVGKLILALPGDCISTRSPPRYQFIELGAGEIRVPAEESKMHIANLLILPLPGKLAFVAA